MQEQAEAANAAKAQLAAAQLVRILHTLHTHTHTPHGRLLLCVELCVHSQHPSASSCNPAACLVSLLDPCTCVLCVSHPSATPPHSRWALRSRATRRQPTTERTARCRSTRAGRCCATARECSATATSRMMIGSSGISTLPTVPPAPRTSGQRRARCRSARRPGRLLPLQSESLQGLVLLIYRTR